jgi:hypothetical protein
MDGAASTPKTVMAKLPSGLPIRVEIAGSDSGDGLVSVGLRDLDLSAALDTVAEVGSVLVEKLKTARPTRATVELKLGFAVEAGKLLALWVSSKGEASLVVTLEWSEHSAELASGDG